MFTADRVLEPSSVGIVGRSFHSNCQENAVPEKPHYVRTWPTAGWLVVVGNLPGRPEFVQVAVVMQNSHGERYIVGPRPRTIDLQSSCTNCKWAATNHKLVRLTEKRTIHFSLSENAWKMRAHEGSELQAQTVASGCFI